MNVLWVIREHRAAFPYPIAHGDDVVEGLVAELVEVFGRLPAHVDLHRFKDANSIGVQRGRFASGAECFYPTLTNSACDPFSHLRARAIMGAEKQDARRRPHQPLPTCFICRIAVCQGWVKRLSAGEIEGMQAL